jgi:CheY-like chemotaxis protein
MVVDDETKTSTLLRSVAIPLGYTVQSCDDYDLAIQKAEAQHFDAIFVSMYPPARDGKDVINVIGRIRKSEQNRSAPIVVLSPNEDVSGLRRAMGEGADLFIAKPVSGERLGRMLAALPEWKRMKRGARLPLVTDVVCTSGGRAFPARSLNISESGMLLRSQGIQKLNVGQEIRLQFKIGEIHSSLNLVARVVRREGVDRFGVAFDSITPEDTNAIHVYVTGKIKGPTRIVPDYWKGTRRSATYEI